MTPNKSKLGKVVTSLVFIFFIMPFVTAIEECSSKQDSEQLPCLILLAYQQNCSNVDVKFYNGTGFLGTKTMQQYSPFFCSTDFNYKNIGVYNFNYTTGDHGTITVQEGNKMVYLIYFGLILIALLMILGLKLQNHSVLVINGLLMLVVGVWIFINGFSVYNNMVTQMVGTVIFALGGYFTIMSSMALIEENS